MLWQLVSKNGQSQREATPADSEFMSKIDANEIKEVTIYLAPNAYEVQGEFKVPADTKFRTTIAKEDLPAVSKALRDKNLKINVKEVHNNDWLILLVNAAPLLLLAGFVFFLMRQMQAGRNKALTFGKLPARLLFAQQQKETFKRVPG